MDKQKKGAPHRGDKTCDPHATAWGVWVSKLAAAQVHCGAVVIVSDLLVGAEYQRLGLVVVNVHGKEEGLVKKEVSQVERKAHWDGNTPNSPCPFRDCGAVGAHTVADRLARIRV